MCLDQKAIGSTFRRIAAKIACNGVRDEIGQYLRPKQIGFNTKGGCEAALHTCRTFVRKNKKSKKIILKIDFKNAFNCVERDILLRTIKEKGAINLCIYVAMLFLVIVIIFW